MKVTINGDERELPDGSTLVALLELLDMTRGRVAVEINQEIIPRSQHKQHLLHDGDKIEIVHAIGGG
ncbi:sulfur carrier protein ThiS [Pseudohongiella nitratireducens]|jgi:sulfur carrier protein|uniref:Sulfur carrier protein ThiS n=1 Tax=Pseudohongiella nitratireducens TaxID=1768907 RepID=A0A917GMP9_9GAMM|nr:sulfur carrier protein ThiS [Pseudohongiella nitratireducens]MDF1622078.1 sulfur carrier protein ThiS [Pseudohongiella nitratireducens]GGG51585.1 sulfur carrier protein ThiS [Pseudohongiella nitratireducens]|tara:strand:- start:2054 stop:2254 length:201 start_codon:yes stop_codon:yes gene_type:complete